MPKEGGRRDRCGALPPCRGQTQSRDRKPSLCKQLEGRFGGDQANQAPDQWQLAGCAEMGSAGGRDKTGVPAQERLDDEESEFRPFSLRSFHTPYTVVVVLS